MKSMKQTTTTTVEAPKYHFPFTMVFVYGILFAGWVTLQLVK